MIHLDRESDGPAVIDVDRCAPDAAAPAHVAVDVIRPQRGNADAARPILILRGGNS